MIMLSTFMCLLHCIRDVLNAQGNAIWNHETRFTERLAIELSSRPEVNSIWVGANIQNDDCVIHDSFYSDHTTLEYDIGYSQVAENETPGSLIQIKLARGEEAIAYGGPWNEPLYFLADCLYIAIDSHLSGGLNGWSIAWLPSEMPEGRWERIVIENEEIEIVLNPELVVNRIAENDEWMNADDGVFQPDSRNIIRMILGKSSNPTIIGWYNRIPGEFRARFRIHCFGDEGNSRVVAYELVPGSTTFNGEMPLLRWLP